MDALLDQPDRHTSLGVRDHALLLFLYNSGALANEAAKLTIGNLQLGTSPSVRLHGKGNKIRICPLWPTTATSLHRYYGRPHNYPALNGFHRQMHGIWLRCLRRCSQKSRRMGWSEFETLTARFPLPTPRITRTGRGVGPWCRTESGR
ncbi:hypothetical protein [Mesorhizobium abyssinicae]|uniref:hypothetical protein n=1 Tax=Mesorhizobium abyssinicae TaxID=1209958 RepID=UPI003CFB235D